MRDPGFVAAHRGGPLTLDRHRELIRWGRDCIEHVLPLATVPLDKRLVAALATAREWEAGKIKTGVGMRASLAAHAAARDLSNPIDVALARGIGQAVAAAHMADHSLGGALYALRAVSAADGDVEAERQWQIARVPESSRELILQALRDKGRHFKL